MITLCVAGFILGVFMSVMMMFFIVFMGMSIKHPGNISAIIFAPVALFFLAAIYVADRMATIYKDIEDRR